MCSPLESIGVKDVEQCSRASILTLTPYFADYVGKRSTGKNKTPPNPYFRQRLGILKVNNFLEDAMERLEREMVLNELDLDDFPACLDEPLEIDSEKLEKIQDLI